MDIHDRRYRGQRFLSVFCYGLASLVGIVGVISTAYLEIYAVNLPRTLSAFQFVAGPLVNLIARPIGAALSYVGIAILLISLVVCAVLYACGKLVARQVELSVRLALLEQRLAGGEPQPNEEVLAPKMG